MRAIIVTIISGLAILDSVLALEPLPAFHRELYFKRIGLPVHNVTEYRLSADGTLTQLTERPSSKRTNQRIDHRQVTEQAWEKFHKTLLNLKINRWKKAYSPAGEIADGYLWQMRFVSNDGNIESQGHEAGPDPDDPSKTLYPGDAVTGDILLLRALDKLWSESAVTRQKRRAR